MGYTTHFYGEFANDSTETVKSCEIDEKTERMLHAFDPNFDDYKEAKAEFEEFLADMKSKGILDPNEEYRGPGGCNQWVVAKLRFSWCRRPGGVIGVMQFLKWDGGEKFYYYVEWLKHIIKYLFAPRGYVFNGKVKYFGENDFDMGVILVENNVVKHFKAQFSGTEGYFVDGGRA